MGVQGGEAPEPALSRSPRAKRRGSRRDRGLGVSPRYNFYPLPGQSLSLSVAKERGSGGWSEEFFRTLLAATPAGIYDFMTLHSFVMLSLASPKSIMHFGLKYRSLSTPAKPGRMLRFRTTIAFARSTSRIGIP